MNATAGMVASVAALVATTVTVDKSNNGFRELVLSFVDSDLFWLLLIPFAFSALCLFFRLLFGGGKDE